MTLGRTLCVAVLLTGFLALNASAAVVVNELYYDHPGTDTNHEFIELYNNGGADVDLTGWQIQWGGTDFTYGTYDFPGGTIIYAGDYLLIGGSETANDFGVTPDLINAFNFQNGGSGSGPTDAARVYNLLDYHDTCLYDSPNSNNLDGDPYGSGPADSTQLCPDVDAGHSLSRINVGVDNNLATDWEDLAAPTPTASSMGVTISNIADIRINDANGMPLYLDSLVTITGIITCAAELGSTGPAYMYDNTAAVAVYDNTVSSSGIAIGDSVIVTGWVGFFSGLTEIVDEPLSGVPDVAFQIISSGHEVTPVEILASAIAEDIEGYLVRINGATFVETGLFQAGVVHYAYVGSDTFAVYIDSSTPIPGTPIPLEECDIIGQLGQYDTSSPYFDGYQINPRFTDDIVVYGLEGPTITGTEPIPYLPDNLEDVVINSFIYDDVSVSSAYVYYDGGAGWVQLELFDDGLHNDGAAGDSLYGNTIPGFAAGTTVNFYIEATDNDANTTYDPPDAPTSYYSYYHHDYSVITPIADLRENDSLGMPVHLDEVHTVVGYVSAAAEFGYAGPASIQSDLDGGYGISIYDPIIETAGLAIGDEIMVTGWVGFYSGLTQFVDDPYNANYNPVIEVLSSGHTLTPCWIEDLDDISENHESLLIEIKGVRFTQTGTFAASTNYDVTMGADTAEIRVDYDTNIPGNPIPEDPVNIVGVMSQYDYSSPYTTGFQIQPRFIEDIATPDLYVTLVPTSPPVIIPATGGTFEYRVDVYNTGTTGQTVNVWFVAELPNGSHYQITPVALTFTFPAGFTTYRIREQAIPQNAPAGDYSYRLLVGDYAASTVACADGFPFTKEAVGEGTPVDNWESRWLTDWLWKEIDPDQTLASGALPQHYALDQNYPNPFNPLTTIRFALPNAEYTLLQVFNLQGRLVATAVDGYRQAGYHEVTVDGSALTSGVYIYRIQAGGFTASGKMVLMK